MCGERVETKFWGGVLFNVFYANLKFREILVQLYAMHAKYYLLLVSWVVLIYYMCWGRVCFEWNPCEGFIFFGGGTN